MGTFTQIIALLSEVFLPNVPSLSVNEAWTLISKIDAPKREWERPPRASESLGLSTSQSFLYLSASSIMMEVHAHFMFPMGVL